ncbi:MAG: hypothetical protein GX591_17470 [Planctomycetes bacterium]|nr:hypothetical protein [Planctomycetota bacterium]
MVSRRPATDAAHVWTAAGLLWPATNLAALAAGLFPRAIDPAASAASPPALQALAVGQVAFALVAWPVMIQARGRRSWRLDAAELVLWSALAAPFVGAAACIADAGGADVVRLVLIVVTAFVAGWLLGRAALAGRTAASAALVVGLLAAAGLPAAVCLPWESAAGGVSGCEPAALWRLCPTTFAWSALAGDRDAWLPSPVWPPLIWPAVAAMFWSLGHWRAGRETRC